MRARWQTAIQQPHRTFAAGAAAGKEGRQDVAQCAAAGGTAHLCSSRKSVQAPQAWTQTTQIQHSETLLITSVGA